MLFDGLFGKSEPAFTDGESNEAMRKRYLEVGIQIPLYEVLREGDGWEVRRYQPLAVAECDYDKRPEGYELLGGYAGGENEFGISMPRTAPCVMQPSREPKRMMWVLPTPHTPRCPTWCTTRRARWRRRSSPTASSWRPARRPT